MSKPMISNWDRNFLYLLFFVIVLRFLVMGIPEITPQDAYYWQYSRHIDWGYFDHPGMTAYSINFFCNIFGDNLYGIRTTALFYSIVFMIFMYLLGKRLFDKKTGFFSALAMAFSPLGIVGGLFVTPDPALICFWVGAVFFFHKAWKGDGNWWYLLAGVFTGLAMLSKYTAVFLFLGYAILFFFTKRGRKALKTPYPWLALLLSILFFMPQIYWNYKNEWVSFAFQSTKRAKQVKALRLDYFFGYLASQLLVITPVLYSGMIYHLFARIKTAVKKREDIFFILSFSLPMLLFFSFVGLFYWIKVNWLAPAYLTGVILFFGIELKKSSKKIVKIAVWSCIVLGIILNLQLAFSIIPASGEMMTVAGWKLLTQEVESEIQDMPNPTDVFVFGWQYKVPSVLAFYLEGQPQTFANDVLGKHLLQYQFWFDEAELIGRDAIFVVDKRQKFVPTGTSKRSWREMEIPARREVERVHLTKYFANVEFAGDFLPEYNGKKITCFSIFRCYNYLGIK